jgi:hypothetical protein
MLFLPPHGTQYRTAVENSRVEPSELATVEVTRKELDCVRMQLVDPEPCGACVTVNWEVCRITNSAVIACSSEYHV